MTTRARKSADPGRSPETNAAPREKPIPIKNARRINTPKHTSAPASTSKQDRCLDLLARREGASLVELVAATDWQPHSIRGFLSGTVKKKLGLTLHAAQGDDGSRRYRINRPSRSR
jgi:hypothetical protein